MAFWARTGNTSLKRELKVHSSVNFHREKSWKNAPGLWSLNAALNFLL